MRKFLWLLCPGNYLYSVIFNSSLVPGEVAKNKVCFKVKYMMRPGLRPPPCRPACFNDECLRFAFCIFSQQQPLQYSKCHSRNIIIRVKPHIFKFRFINAVCNVPLTRFTCFAVKNTLLRLQRNFKTLFGLRKLVLMTWKYLTLFPQNVLF